YHRHHPSLHSFPTRRSSDLYFNDYKKWSQTSLDTTMNSLRAAGLQGQQLNNAQAVLAQLRTMSTGAGGQMQAVEVGNQIAEQQRSEEHTSELQSLAYLVCRL